MLNCTLPRHTDSKHTFRRYLQQQAAGIAQIGCELDSRADWDSRHQDHTSLHRTSAVRLSIIRQRCETLSAETEECRPGQRQTHRLFRSTGSEFCFVLISMWCCLFAVVIISKSEAVLITHHFHWFVASAAAEVCQGISVPPPFPVDGIEAMQLSAALCA